MSASPDAQGTDPAAQVRLHALVPCAGVGTRAGAGLPKQYRPVGNSTVVGHTLRSLQGVPRLSRVWVVLAPNDTLFESACPGFAGEVLRCGGETRAASVLAGLRAMQAAGVAEQDWVLVHDAARCLVQPQAVDRLIDAGLDEPVGALLARPVADTLHRAQDGHVGGQTPRDALWQAQTPQMFRLGLLRQALEQGGAQVTDEASAVSALGLRPRLVAGPVDNIKLTHPDDFLLAERLLGAVAGVSRTGHDQGRSQAAAGEHA